MVEIQEHQEKFYRNAVNSFKDLVPGLDADTCNEIVDRMRLHFNLPLPSKATIGEIIRSMSTEA